MNQTLFHYGVVTEAIHDYQNQGYTIDFNLEGKNFISSGNEKYNLEEFEIVDLCRYEGESDPGDGAIVYALESKSGLKGVLVAGYGIYTSSEESKMLEKLKFRSTM